MVVIQCPTCRRRLDTVSPTCPGCGKALVRDTGWKKRPLLFDVVGFLGIGSAILWLIWWLLTGPSF